MLYTRLDLDTYEIRLLNIEAAPDDQDIHCTLESTTLIDPGNYYALSYCWGDARGQKKIVVNNAIVEVGYNLEAALRKLRSRGYLRIWTDALCINQEDLEEKGLQIRNMIKIYSRAMLVVSWLGDDPENIAPAVKYLLEYGRYIHFPGRRATALGQGYIFNRGITGEQKEWDDQRWRIFQSFCELEYWRRVWIIQEVASGIRLEVLFGSVAIPWNLITTALRYWKGHSDEVPKACMSYQYAARLDHFRDRFTSASGKSISLFEAIQLSHYAKATEQRDRIYALLGLTSDGPRLVPTPNYKQTLEEVLRDLTRAMVDSEKSLDFASLKFQSPVKGEWPSRTANSIYFWSEIITALGAPMCSWNMIFPRPQIQQVLDERILQAQGTLLGSICQLSSFANDGPFVTPPLMGPVDVYYDRCVSPIAFRSNYPSGIETAILQSLSLGQVPTGIDFRRCLNNFWRLNAPEEVSGDIERIIEWNNINLWLRQNSSLPIGVSTLEKCSQMHSKTNQLKHFLHPSDMEYSYNDFRYCLDRIDKVLQSSMRLMVTETGLIGMAPPNARIGDKIYYTKGCSIPVILRERERPLHSTAQELFVIGGIYIHVDGKFSRSLNFSEWAETYVNKSAGLQTIILS